MSHRNMNPITLFSSPLLFAVTQIHLILSHFIIQILWFPHVTGVHVSSLMFYLIYLIMSVNLTTGP